MSSCAEDDKRLSFLTEEEAVVCPPGIVNHIANSWWSVHPTKGLIFFKKHSPQCNTNKELAERIAASLYPWAVVKFFPSVFININPRDYVS